MKWQCALLQRWLPEYPDGDIPGWGNWWLNAHVAHCAACRQELAEIKEVVKAIKASANQNLAPEFWSDFSRDMHLKLVQSAQETAPAPPARQWLKVPYLVGAPALAVLLVWVAVHLTGPVNLPQNQTRMMQGVKPEAALKKVTPRVPSPPAVVAAPIGDLEQFVPVALGEREASQVDDEVDISGWDLDSELAGMTDHEKEVFLKRMHQRAKDGSCLEKYSLCSWA